MQATHEYFSSLSKRERFLRTLGWLFLSFPVFFGAIKLLAVLVMLVLNVNIKTATNYVAYGMLITLLSVIVVGFAFVLQFLIYIFFAGKYLKFWKLGEITTNV